MAIEIKNKTNATDESFWSMLDKAGSEFSIYIPRIQRDYAQGRLDPATTQIRDKFVDDIFDSIVNFETTGKSLDVNFIYGNIEAEGDKKRFIPIDGQQRLTTLFLLHWYFAVFSGKIDSDPNVKKRLLQFQYETRNVTGKFCRNLTEWVRVDLKNFPANKKVSDAIRNYYWFFSDFDNDSSVRAMLVMIDTIHEKAMSYLRAGVSLDGVFDLLTSDRAPIRFLYLNIDDVGLTDSIYIKMNARGKALTHFENFKAQLRNYLSNDTSFANEFIDNINGRWSEFFWTKDYRKVVKDPVSGKEILETSFDSHMMKFFRFCMLMNYIVSVDDEAVVNNQKKIRDSLRDLLKERDYVFTSRLFKDAFQNVYGIKAGGPVVTENAFRQINILLNVLSKRQQEKHSIAFANSDEFNKSYLAETRAFRRLIGATDERGLSNEEQIVLYAEYAFLIKHCNSDYSFGKEVELNRWLRLVSNLIQPTLNLQLDIFFNMIRTLHRLVEDGSALDCEAYMRHLIRRNYRQSGMSVFTESQVVEESIKAILMDNDSNWTELIAQSENTFFDGQTGALFAFSGLTAEYEKQIADYQEKNPEALELDESAVVLAGIGRSSEFYSSFQEYLAKFNLLFDANGVRKEVEEKALFRRALLCYGKKNSYMLPPGKALQSFLDNTDRDYGFKRLLRDNNGDKRGFLKELLDDLNLEDPVTDQLQAIIDKKTFDEDDRWKQYFIKMPEILDCVYKNDDSKRDPRGEWIFMNPKRFIRRNNNDDILILTKTQTNSINRELYSYVLFLKARKAGLKMDYHPDYTDGAEKYASYESNVNGQVNIVYKKKADGKYYFTVRKQDDTEIISYDKIEDMLDYVTRTIK